MATPITQKKVCPIVMSVKEHILGSIGLRRKDALIVDRQDILKRNVPSWDNSAVGISTGEAWPGDSHTGGEMMEILLRPVSYSLVLVSGGEPQMFRELKQECLP